VQLAFRVGRREAVDDFRRAGQAAGGRGHANGGVADPDGNVVEAVNVGA
jgi:hypothetical protein